MKTLNIPIECNSTPTEISDQQVNWSSIQDYVSSVVPLENGISAKVAIVAAQGLRDLAAGEAECCPSILFEITESGEELGLQITSEINDTVQAIQSMFSVSGK